jgi:hypothetical protein
MNHSKEAKPVRTETLLTEQISLIDPISEMSMSKHDEAGRDALFLHILATDTVSEGQAGRRRLRRRTGSLVGGILGLAAATATCVLVVAGSGPAPRSDYALGGPISLASWTVTPTSTTVSSDEIDACATRLYDGTVDSGALTVSNAETRGEFNAFQLFGAASPGYCILFGDQLLVAEQIPANGFDGDASDVATTEATTDMIGMTATATATSMGDSNASPTDAANVGVAEGRVGADVTQVTVNLSNGKSVTASVENGVWSAWWPLDEDVVATGVGYAMPTIAFTTSDGTAGIATQHDVAAGSAGDILHGFGK